MVVSMWGLGDDLGDGFYGWMDHRSASMMVRQVMAAITYRCSYCCRLLKRYTAISPLSECTTIGSYYL